MKFFRLQICTTAVLGISLAMSVGCKPKPQPQPQDPGAHDGSVSWDECLSEGNLPKIEGDPQGQGRELLGLGFKLHPTRPNSPFVRIDRFDVAKVTDRSGAKATKIGRAQ